ncbi:MAG: hypothetical protein ACD_4C00143G0008 [uncultured bacterium (gcode 4)]|uniref:Uncharacterized protein n=1 Tax=uncultured bacterium (gcode 4) TaxID=1234023 RepID=K2FV14_9BACT|nr:MAG: hypothetical protein ACD_4C00143G0008 [uncultured bacterium (gcode 4)]
MINICQNIELTEIFDTLKNNPNLKISIISHWIGYELNWLTLVSSDIEKWNLYFDIDNNISSSIISCSHMATIFISEWIIYGAFEFISLNEIKFKVNKFSKKTIIQRQTRRINLLPLGNALNNSLNNWWPIKVKINWIDGVLNDISKSWAWILIRNTEWISWAIQEIQESKVPLIFIIENEDFDVKTKLIPMNVSYNEEWNYIRIWGKFTKNLNNIEKQIFDFFNWIENQTLENFFEI